jgi:hypothetical protein
VGAACAIATVIAFVVGIVFMATSGVQVLIPETGKNGLDWIRDVDEAGGAFFVGAWLLILGGVLGLVGLIGFYEALRRVGSWFVLAPILGAVGLTLVTISHLIPIAMAYELVPGYVSGDAATRASLATTADTFAVLARVVNYTGDVILWGVVVPMYAIAVLKTSVLPRWIGWLGVGVGVFAGLGDALSPASSVIEGITFIGFVGFFVWNGRHGRIAPPSSMASSAPRPRKVVEFFLEREAAEAMIGEVREDDRPWRRLCALTYAEPLEDQTNICSHMEPAEKVRTGRLVTLCTI